MAFSNRLEALLPRVQKPARYLGNEWNAIQKDHDAAAVRAVLIFPDLYEVGMSNLGLQILYHAVNREAGLLAERCFAPAADMEALLRENDLPLFALESRVAVREFDVVGFSLQYELSYTNVLNLLDLSRIPLHAAVRDAGPLVIAGGPCAFNPEPLAPYLDLVIIGDGETVLPALLHLRAAQLRAGTSRSESLAELASLPGAYVPSFYRPLYRGVSLIGLERLHPAAPEKVKKSVVADLETAPYPVKPVVPHLQSVHDRAVLELFRGCARGCRFCQAGVIYRPVRRRSRDTLKRLARETICSTGYDEISLASLSSSDYPALDRLAADLATEIPGGMVKFSLPSMRADSFSVGLAQQVLQGRRSSFTFAPEAATERLRRVIGKNITRQDLFEAVAHAVELGRYTFKLYFMLGLPTETDEDVLAIAHLCRELIAYFREPSRGRLRLTVSAAVFVPKAHTPFQWEPQLALPAVRARQRLLSEAFRKIRGAVLHCSDPEAGFLEAVLARGDRRLAPVLETAWRGGSRFDSWKEHFLPAWWREAFAMNGMDPAGYAYRRFRDDETLPWDHLGTTLPREYLLQEHRAALGEKES